MTRGRWLAVILGALLLLCVAAFGLLFTNPGEALLRRLAVWAIEKRTHETIEIARLEFHGDRVVLHEVHARAFDAEILDVDLSVRSLWRRGLKVDRLAVTGYRLRLEPGPAKKVEPRALPDFSIDALALEDGVVEAPASKLRIKGVALTGAVAHQGGLWRGSIALHGGLAEPIQAPLALTAEADATGEAQTARVQATAGKNRIDAQLSLPSMDRAGLARADGHVAVNVPAFSTSGFTYGPLTLEARLKRGQPRVRQLELELPGLRAVSGPPGDGVFSETVEVEDLATTSRALHALLGRTLPELGGHGALQIRFGQPGLTLEGQFTALAAGAVLGRGLKLGAHVPRVTQPDEGRLWLTAERVEVGSSQPLRSVRIDAKRGEGKTELNAALVHPVAASAHAVARDDGLIEQLMVRTAGAAWKATGGPAHVRLTRTGVTLEALALTDDNGQRVAVQGAWGEERKNVVLGLSRIRLERLPLPVGLGAAGLVDGEVKLARPAHGLEGTANLTLSQVRLAGLTEVSAQIATRIAATRIDGSITGSALEGAIAGRFNLPANLSRQGGVAAHVTIDGASLGRAWGVIEAHASKAIAGRLKDPSGRLNASVDVQGTWAEPRVKARLGVAGGAFTVEGAGRYAGLSIDALAEATEREVTLPHLVVRAADGSLEVSGTASRASGNRAFGYELKVAANHFPLLLEEPVLATLKAEVRGSATVERITSKVTITRLQIDRMTKAPAPGS